jgi:hypothetical protein
MNSINATTKESGDRWSTRSQAQMIERMLRHAQARQQDLEK